MPSWRARKSSTATDPPGGEHIVDEDVARKLVRHLDSDDVPLTTDEPEQKSDSVVRPDNS